MTPQRLARRFTRPSYFYGALLLSRIVVPVTLQRVSDTRQASFGALLATVSSFVLISPGVFQSLRFAPYVQGSAYPL
jgi:hypothetical protein